MSLTYIGQGTGGEFQHKLTVSVETLKLPPRSLRQKSFTLEVVALYEFPKSKKRLLHLL